MHLFQDTHPHPHPHPQQLLDRMFGISFEKSLETLPSDDSLSRDEIAIMVAGLTLTLTLTLLKIDSKHD